MASTYHIVQFFNQNFRTSIFEASQIFPLLKSFVALNNCEGAFRNSRRSFAKVNSLRENSYLMSASVSDLDMPLH